MAAKTESKEVRDLAAYGQIVLHLAGKHGGKGWMAYDKLFRQQQSAGATMPWAELNPSLMAATVLGNSGEQGRICTLCMASDHSAYECALASIESATKPGARGPQLNSAKSTVRARNHPYYYYRDNAGYTTHGARTYLEEPCRRFNRGNCNMVACKFEHVCSACPARGPHPAISCPTTKTSGRPRQQTGGSPAPPPPPATTQA